MLKKVIHGWNAAPGAPKGWDPMRDGECSALPVRVYPPAAINGSARIEYCELAWEPTPAELADLAAGGQVVLRVVAWQVPVALYVEPPAPDLDQPTLGRAADEMLAGLSGGAMETLRCLFLHGPTTDGDVPSKQGRDELVAVGYAEHRGGYAYLTSIGVQAALATKLGEAKETWQRSRSEGRPEALDSFFSFMWNTMIHGRAVDRSTVQFAVSYSGLGAWTVESEGRNVYLHLNGIGEAALHAAHAAAAKAAAAVSQQPAEPSS